MGNKLALLGGSAARTKPFPSWPVFGKEERENLLAVFDSGKWWHGEKVAEFERKFADFQDAKYGVACANGTVALEMAVRACGIGAGDEVIVPPYTFIATASAVLNANAIPVFADIELETCNLDPRDAAKKITGKTKAIIPVHFAGLPVDMDAFQELAKKHNLKLIEDACHSWGSKWKGKGTGALGDCGAFSFQMSKNITAGEGGILLSDNEEIAEKARSISNCGRMKGKEWYEHFVPGTNYRLTELQAAILLGQLSRLENQTLKREANASFLDDQLKDIPGIALVKGDSRVTRRSYHLYGFRFLEQEWHGATREQFLKAMQAEGILFGTAYPAPIYKNPVFQQYGKGPKSCPVTCPYHGGKINYADCDCPNAETFCRQACWLSHAVLLAEKEDMRDIADAVRKVWDNREQLKNV